MHTFTFEVTMRVADRWVEDGFGGYNRDTQRKMEEQVKEALETELLTSANLTTEFQVYVKTLRHPNFRVVGVLQGYYPKSDKELKRLIKLMVVMATGPKDAAAVKAAKAKLIKIGLLKKDGMFKVRYNNPVFTQASAYFDRYM